MDPQLDRRARGRWSSGAVDRGIVVGRCVTTVPLMIWCLALASCKKPIEVPGPNIVLITVDTLRADQVGVYSDRPSLTPHIDALAAEGVVFENAAAPMPLTRPSHFSIFSGQYPREHGVMNNEIALPGDITTLAEILATNGYRTGGFASVILLDRHSGGLQGFEDFSTPNDDHERPGSETIDDTLDWLGSVSAGEPVFAWVHLFEPHLPYAPPASFRGRLEPGLDTEWPALDWNQLQSVARQNGGDIPSEWYDHAVELYRGEVAYTDRLIGRLLEGLDSTGRRDNTMIVFTADHGESFENGVYFEHRDSLFDGAIRVPLIVSYRGTTLEWPRPGERVPDQVSLVDVAPTILLAAGIDLPPSYSGLPLQQASQSGERYVLIQHPFLSSVEATSEAKLRRVIRTVRGEAVADLVVEKERVGLVGSHWKLIRTDDATALYDRLHESREVSAGNPELATELEARLDRALESHPLTLVEPDEINEDLRDSLEALGYLD